MVCLDDNDTLECIGVVSSGIAVHIDVSGMHRASTAAVPSNNGSNIRLFLDRSVVPTFLASI